MSRTLVSRSRCFLSRETKQGGLLSNGRRVGMKEGEKAEVQGKETKNLWVPHPRNGIYYPKGHEWVMNDVPETAAALCQKETYWLRGAEGVDEPSSHF
ncbi:hypothetical protein H6P81_020387 [Aristolochia fimbriata]|uniref:Uncharacterized protein n=1 Tax=Aristolochia fimbriata TaxID=158543 RepID=A0AAV7DXI7_ARIFI|nr:hypothetical protein H6P81_020387 [Aristolochia fimbriata]